MQFIGVLAMSAFDEFSMKLAKAMTAFENDNVPDVLEEFHKDAKIEISAGRGDFIVCSISNQQFMDENYYVSAIEILEYDDDENWFSEKHEYLHVAKVYRRFAQKLIDVASRIEARSP
jgi:hypothetical protein